MWRKRWPYRFQELGSNNNTVREMLTHPTRKINNEIFQMKRSPFKRKPTVPMKRTRLKKVSKQSISLLQRKLWLECKRIIREQFGNTCYTCQRKGLEASNWHTGHLYPKASVGAYLKYDLRILRPQCYHCNINLGGNGATFYQNMLKIEGKDYMDRIEKDKQVSIKAYDHYTKLLIEYRTITK